MGPAPRPAPARLGAYGLPAFEDGRWWTVLAGAFFAARPLQYIPILLGLTAFGGFAEWRLGTGRYAVALVTCHVVAVLAAAVLLWLTRDHGYLWTTTLARVIDAGPSAAFLGAAAAASVTLTPPWPGRLRILLVAYVVLFVIYMGALSDLEHVFGVMWGLALEALLYGRVPKLTFRQLTLRTTGSERARPCGARPVWPPLRPRRAVRSGLLRPEARCGVHVAA